MAINATRLPFNEQAEFFRRKINLPTEGWTDIYREQHDWAFMVAGANRDAIVEDFRSAVDRVVSEGGTLADFRKEFDAIVQRHGWSYNGGRNWRSRVIYDTNLNSSYMAGRYEQLLAVREQRPYWRYLHNDAVEHPRPLHQSWHGLILRWDNPWWRAHFPVNAWGCQCRVEALSEADMRRMGYTLSETPEINYEEKTIGIRSDNPRTVRVPEGIDPGFEYVPGQSRLHGAVPAHNPQPPLPGTSEAITPNTRASDALPRPQPQTTPALTPSEFLQTFNATPQTPALYRDVIGETIAVGSEMLANTTISNATLATVAQALRAPDEIWVFIEQHAAAQKAVVRRRYLARFTPEGGGAPVAVVFEKGRDGWRVIDSTTNADFYIDDMRVGVRLYQRED